MYTQVIELPKTKEKPHPVLSLIPLLNKATVYTQVSRPLPKPLSDAERGFESYSPSLAGKGLGVRSGSALSKISHLCVHGSLNKERDRFCTAFIRVRYLQGCSINLKTPSTTTCVYTVAPTRREKDLNFSSRQGEVCQNHIKLITHSLYK